MPVPPDTSLTLTQISLEFALFEEARKLRNPLTHFNTPMHEELPESRALREGAEPYDVVEDDAKQILEVVFRLVERNAAG
jgi:hypothetical protein